MRHQSGGARHLQCPARRDRRALRPSAAHAGPHLLETVAAVMTAAAAESAAALADRGVTIVTQTRVRAGEETAFAQWQRDTSGTIAGFPGFVQQTVLPPSPPAQLDWVIQQRFTHTAAATAWLNSKERLERVAGAQAMLIGRDDVHIVPDG